MPEEAVAPLFSLDVERTERAIVVRCHGKLISGVTGTLHAKVSQLIPGAKLIVLDLGDLTYMDSMGLGVLVRLYVSAKAAGCELQLMHLGKRVRELLSITNLLSVFTIIGEHGGIVRF
jgi:anti-sigma B factor antagonist